MVRPSRKRLAAAVLDRFGRTFCKELLIPVERNTPSALFRTLCFAMLSAKRISHRTALSAAKALFGQGWTTARKLAAATWSQRTWVLNQSGYARYDESTSRMLGQTCQLLLEAYGGDLRKLREAAGYDPACERTLLKQCKGMGDVGADIFFREAQVAWKELFPFADRMALKAAVTLGLGDDARALLPLVEAGDFARLVAGLVRVQLEDGFDEVRRSAASRGRGAA